MLDKNILATKNNFFETNYFAPTKECYKLEEKGNDRGQGKSILTVEVGTENNLCIPNFDVPSKRIDYKFLKSNTGIAKKIDHLIFRKNGNEKWETHLIEMKTTVDSEKVQDIKKKFFAGYWNAKIFAMFLGIEIEDVNIFLYTTYQDTNFKIKNTPNPKANFPVLGKKILSPEREWNQDFLKLNLRPYSGISINEVEFPHKKIQMQMISGELVGSLHL